MREARANGRGGCDPVQPLLNLFLPVIALRGRLDHQAGGEMGNSWGGFPYSTLSSQSNWTPTQRHSPLPKATTLIKILITSYQSFCHSLQLSKASVFSLNQLFLISPSQSMTYLGFWINLFSFQILKSFLNPPYSPVHYDFCRPPSTFAFVGPFLH